MARTQPRGREASPNSPKPNEIVPLEGNAGPLRPTGLRGGRPAAPRPGLRRTCTWLNTLLPPSRKPRRCSGKGRRFRIALAACLPLGLWAGGAWAPHHLVSSNAEPTSWLPPLCPPPWPPRSLSHTFRKRAWRFLTGPPTALEPPWSGRRKPTPSVRGWTRDSGLADQPSPPSRPPRLVQGREREPNGHDPSSSRGTGGKKDPDFPADGDAEGRAPRAAGAPRRGGRGDGRSQPSAAPSRAQPCPDHSRHTESSALSRWSQVLRRRQQRELRATCCPHPAPKAVDTRKRNPPWAPQRCAQDSKKAPKPAKGTRWEEARPVARGEGPPLGEPQKCRGPGPLQRGEGNWSGAWPGSRKPSGGLQGRPRLRTQALGTGAKPWPAGQKAGPQPTTRTAGSEV